VETTNRSLKMHNIEQTMSKKETIHKLTKGLTDAVDSGSICEAIRFHVELGQELIYLRCDCLEETAQVVRDNP